MSHVPSAQTASIVSSGEAILGIEFGSTRIKATLIAPDGTPLASGSHGWENRLVDGVWTYDLQEVWSGVQGAYAELSQAVRTRYNTPLTRLAACGISAMMHGYLAFDDRDELLVPFRTWRNNITEEASRLLTNLFSRPVPQRWSVAHLYQALLNGEEHLPRVARLTTLAGYVHHQLTGRFVLGADDASGMFPIDISTHTYDARCRELFDTELTHYPRIPWKIGDLLPCVLRAGEDAGQLTERGAHLLDPTETLQPHVPLCPPEGDAGTGMVATNSVRPRTGNVSAGTSAFAMVVLEHPLQRVHPELDIVLTPDGSAVAMAHTNNCTSDFDSWVRVLGEAAATMGGEGEQGALFQRIMPLALQGDADAGGVTVIPYVSGEHVAGLSQGRPLILRDGGAPFSLANLVRAHLMSAICAMRIGLEILTNDEGVAIDEVRGHGGYFKTPEVGQRLMAASIGAPCRVMESAAEGGSWGIALLAAYLIRPQQEQSLADYLDELFAEREGHALHATREEIDGFSRYFARYMQAVEVERIAVEGSEGDR